MKRILLVISWFNATLICLVLSLFLLRSYSQVKLGNALLVHQVKVATTQNGYQFYASLPEVLGSFSQAVEKGDARPELVRLFLERHESPLLNYADHIVTVSDAQSIDFRLIPAIGMCESNLGKKIPEGSYNAWGYAIYTGQDSGAQFSDWNHAISIMANYLASKYYANGLMTPEDIGPIYAPPSVNTDNSWAKCVRKFMDELI